MNSTAGSTVSAIEQRRPVPTVGPVAGMSKAVIVADIESLTATSDDGDPPDDEQSARVSRLRRILLQDVVPITLPRSTVAGDDSTVVPDGVAICFTTERGDRSR